MKSIKTDAEDARNLTLKDIKCNIELLEMCFGSQAEVDHMLVVDGYAYVVVCQNDVE